MNAPAKPIAAALARAREAWPRLVWDEAVLASLLEALGPALEQADVPGLALVQACLAGDAVAIAEFDRILQEGVRVALSRRTASRHEVDEVTQRLRLAIFAPQGKRSRLQYYSGRGALHGWVRALAAQDFVTYKRREGPWEPREALTEAFLDAATSPEVKWVREEALQAFRAALEEALGALTDRERTVLKLSALDGLSIDDIGRMYQTHRSTAARWLARAREQVDARVRASLVRALGPSAADLGSLLRVEGEPVTLERLLSPRRP